jgi:hypothetical protein
MEGAASVLRPGDRHRGFVAVAGQCWVMVYDDAFQACHNPEPPTRTGRSSRGALAAARSQVPGRRYLPVHGNYEEAVPR